MRSLQLLTAVLAACFLLTSCAASNPPANVLPRPLPAELSVRCPPPQPAPPASGEVDAVALALKDLYDLYGTCAGRMVDLLNWIDGGPTDGGAL